MHILRRCSVIIRRAMHIDLHTHTTASDGTLSPSQLLARARDNNVSHLSVTDHDTVNAYRDFDKTDLQGITLIPGVELSTNWAKRGIHILGLNIDLHNSDLTDGIASQQQARERRAEKIAERLQKAGFGDSMDTVRKLANGGTIGRPHFAQYLVDKGVVADRKQAFRRYLGDGKIGDVRQFWAPMEDVIQWIHAAGGTAVLAHPGHYKLTNVRLNLLTEEFVQAGGQGIEVCNGMQIKTLTDKLSGLCETFKLLASCGSDFHRPGNAWSEVGKFTALPKKCLPVWEHW